MSTRVTSNGASPVAAYEHGAERLLGAITATCDPRAGFAVQVEVALRAALEFLASEPGLARRLTVEPRLGDEAGIRSYQRWQKLYGALLRRAAGAHPELPIHPRFLEPALIGGIRFQIARHVLAGEAAKLEALTPELLQFVLSYYLEPGQASAIVCASG
jgi:hypothetical protein